MRGKKEKNLLPRPVRTHCPDCAMYLDDVVQTHDVISKAEMDAGKGSKFDWLMDKLFPGVWMCPYPGMQFRRYSTGTIYDRLGFLIPCHCATGSLVAQGYKNEEGFDNNTPRMDKTYHRMGK